MTRTKKTIKQQREEDIVEWINDLVDNTKSSKELYEGINTIGRKFQPKRYNRRDIRGNIVDLKDRAEATKEYLENTHWGKKVQAETPGQERTRKNTERIIEQTLEEQREKYNNVDRNTGPITMNEPIQILKNFKMQRHQAQTT